LVVTVTIVAWHARRPHGFHSCAMILDEGMATLNETAHFLSNHTTKF
jgi:hypothetical protein